jgi:parallel beta-helix repeat protein
MFTDEPNFPRRNFLKIAGSMFALSSCNLVPVVSSLVPRQSIVPHLQDPLVININSYGAIGDDSTNNTTAFDNAISDIVSADGGTIYVPKGTYQVNELDLKGADNIKFVGNGVNSILKLRASQSSFLINQNDAEQVSFRYMVFDGNETNQVAGNLGIFKLTASSGDKDGFEIDHCVIQNSYNNGIRVVSGNDNTGVRITNNLWKNCGRAAGHAINIEQHAPGALIHNNEIDTVTNNGGNGIWVGNDSGKTRITNNYIYGTGDMGIEVWQNNLVGHVVVANNIIENTGNGGLGYGISVDDSPHCVVSNNTLRNIKGAGIELVYSNYGAITGNTIEDINDRMGTGIMINKSSYNTVTGNTIKEVGTGSGSNSIRLYADSAGTAGPSDFNVITNNMIIVDADAADINGIGAQNNSATVSISYNIISNNNIIGNNAIGTTGVAFTDSGSGTVEGNIIQHNIIRDFSTGVKIHASVDAGNKVIDNHYTSNTTNEVISDAGTILHTTGTGIPSFSVADGSTFKRSDGGSGTTFYVRESGSWVAK